MAFVGDDAIAEAYQRGREEGAREERETRARELDDRAADLERKLPELCGRPWCRPWVMVMRIVTLKEAARIVRGKYDGR